MARVSVIVPTFNRLAYLREAIDSVMVQTVDDWELIVCDDESTDGTGEYVRAIPDSRVRFVAISHSGRPARVKNAALKLATGRYVAFLDSDDLWEPQKLARQLEAMDAYSRAGWSYTNVTRISASAEPVPEGGVQQWRPYSGHILPELLRMEALVATPTVIVERALVESVGGFDDSLEFGQDYDLWFRLGAASEACAVPERLARVRMHSGARSADRRTVHRWWVRVYEKAGVAADDAAVKAICRSRATYHRMTAAALAADGGHTGEAVREFLGAVVRDPLSIPLWRAVLGRAVPRPARHKRRAHLNLEPGTMNQEPRTLNREPPTTET